MSSSASASSTSSNPNPTTWDPSWSRAGVTYSNGNLSVSGNTKGTKEVRTVASHATGAWYWEVTVTAGDPNSDNGGLGIMDASFSNNAKYLGSAADSLGFGYGNPYATQWWITWPGVTLSPSPPPASSAVSQGVVYMLALDMDAGDFWAGQDGTWYNGGDPGSHQNPVATGLGGSIYSGVTFYPNSTNAFTANFGASPFKYAVPTGFTGGF